jgi:hypothetical protein
MANSAAYPEMNSYHGTTAGIAGPMSPPGSNGCVAEDTISRPTTSGRNAFTERWLTDSGGPGVGVQGVTQAGG